jgi:hypothetical protein
MTGGGKAVISILDRRPKWTFRRNMRHREPLLTEVFMKRFDRPSWQLGASCLLWVALVQMAMGILRRRPWHERLRYGHAWWRWTWSRSTVNGVGSVT